ncbi:hypothetical protein [Streptomyces sp. NPDC003374]
MSHTFEELVAKQRAADEAHTRVEQLREFYGPPVEARWSSAQSHTYETALRAWRDLARDLTAALIEYASQEGRSRTEITAEVEAAARGAGRTGSAGAGPARGGGPDTGEPGAGGPGEGPGAGEGPGTGPGTGPGAGEGPGTGTGTGEGEGPGTGEGGQEAGGSRGGG